MKSIKILAISFILFIMIIIVLTLLIEYEDRNYTPKTYERGLYEGANETLKYLVEKNYINEDVAKIEINKSSSLL